MYKPQAFPQQSLPLVLTSHGLKHDERSKRGVPHSGYSSGPMVLVSGAILFQKGSNLLMCFIGGCLSEQSHFAKVCLRFRSRCSLGEAYITNTQSCKTYVHNYSVRVCVRVCVCVCVCACMCPESLRNPLNLWNRTPILPDNSQIQHKANQQDAGSA